MIKMQQIPFISFPMHDILFILKCGPLTFVLSLVLLNQTKHNVRCSDQNVKENFYHLNLGRLQFETVAYSVS